jgi:hypothetical protein
VVLYQRTKYRVQSAEYKVKDKKKIRLIKNYR